MNLLTRLFLAVLVFASTTHAAATLSPTNLRCEYRTNPLGISSPKPRLSWLLESSNPAERGQRQTAYQIVVASTRENLQGANGDLWSTGKKKSDETIQIEYGGSPLASNQQAF